MHIIALAAFSICPFGDYLLIFMQFHLITIKLQNKNVNFYKFSLDGAPGRNDQGILELATSWHRSSSRERGREGGGEKDTNLLPNGLLTRVCCCSTCRIMLQVLQYLPTLPLGPTLFAGHVWVNDWGVAAGALIAQFSL